MAKRKGVRAGQPSPPIRMIVIKAGVEIDVSVRVPLESLDNLSPDQQAAFLDGIGKIVVAIPQENKSA